MMDYELGSTALAGLVYYTGTQFPEKYRKSFLPAMLSPVVSTAIR